MNKIMKWLETSFAPTMRKINSNVWIVTVKDSILQILPFILLGSLFCIIAIWVPAFWSPFGWTMGMLSLFVSFLIPFNLMEKKGLRKQRLIGGMTGLVLFLLVVSPQVIKDGTIGFGHESLGAGGMFIAIFCGLFTGAIMNAFGKFSFFKEDSVMPDFVRAWFDAMLPIGIVICVGWLVVEIMSLDLYTALLSVFKPLAGFIESWYGFILLMFLYTLLYSMGISTWVLSPVAKPVTLAAITANIASVASGAAITAQSLNLVTAETIYSVYLWVGGTGCTLPLVIMMLRSKAKSTKALGTASLVPGIFNINEPVVFGAIAWNPILMVPMWLQGIILPALVWIFTKVIPFAPIPATLFDAWYMPFPISTWLTTRSVNAVILMVAVVVVSTLLWYPFFKIYEKQQLELEAKNS